MPMTLNKVKKLDCFGLSGEKQTCQTQAAVFTSLCLSCQPLHSIEGILYKLHRSKRTATRTWASAQRDGRPAEYR